MRNFQSGAPNELALFTGVGGGLLASRLLGWNTVCAVEIDEYCRKVLLQRQQDGMLPKFPIWDDVKTFDGRPWRGKIDVISGGFPCQDISAAGQGQGITGERSGLIFEMLRIVDEVRPLFVFAENSPQLRTKGLAAIVEKFISMEYVGRVGVLGARHVGAVHRRDRMWIVAIGPNVTGQQVGARGQSREHAGMGGVSQDVANSNRVRGLQPQGRVLEIGQWLGHCAEQPPNADGEAVREQPRRCCGENWEGSPVVGITDWWSVPRFAGVDDGLADRMDCVKATGNGWVPAVAALAWSVLTSDL